MDGKETATFITSFFAMDRIRRRCPLKDIFDEPIRPFHGVFSQMKDLGKRLSALEYSDG